MNGFTSGRTTLARGILLLGGSLVAAMILTLLIGASNVSLSSAFGGEGSARTILLQVRFPRVILAAIVGATLAAAGATFQTLLRNSMADPFLLGVSGGAACGAAVGTAVGLARVPGLIPLLAFSGACFSTVAVLRLSMRHGRFDSARLILSGLVLNALFSAVIILSLSFSSGSDLNSAVRWMMGGFFSATWADVMLVGVTLIVMLSVLIVIGADLRLMVFGEEDARSRGVSTRQVELIAFFTSSIATGAAVAVSGIIGFVGLLVPHAVRMIWRNDYRLLLPLSAISGAILLVLADGLSRVVAAPAELPLGAITALFGVPFFLYLLGRRT